MVIDHRKPYRLPKKRYPKYLRGFSELKGVYVGECIGQVIWDYDEVAHAHYHPMDKSVGWICLRDRWSLDKEIMLHEVAHLICGNKSRGHDDPWRRQLLKLGGWIEPRYQKKPRK
jgi:hypothetical protein